ncbi:MAG: hypothetical protein BWX45_00532 [Deltaproteobacteria bacterium ADurb.Bin002]|nr:MAG: hypothetical protein BWX45_00532 [Deltaproteobacteria bacterium ADurb.Bin002]
MEHLIRHGRQVFIEQGDQLFRRHFFGNRGEAADVRKQHGQVFLIAAQLELARVLQHFIDNRGGQVVLERAADFLLFPLFLEVMINRDAQINRRHGDQRIDKVQPGVEAEENEEIDHDKGGDHQKSGNHAGDRPQTGNQNPEDQPEKNNRANIDETGHGRVDQKVPVQNIVDDVGVNFDAGKRGGKRRHAQIINADGRRADQNDLVAKGVLRKTVGQNVGNGVMGKRLRRPHIIDQQLPRFIRRNHDIVNGHAIYAERFEIQREIGKIEIGPNQGNGQG